jgi:hypothetical protein
MGWGSPDIAPPVESPAMTAGLPPADAWFEATPYAGAVDPAAAEDWTKASWINYGI